MAEFSENRHISNLINMSCKVDPYDHLQSVFDENLGQDSRKIGFRFSIS